jgi:hypothetical protein
VCFIVHKTTSELEHAILTTLYFTSAKNTDSWCTWKGDLQCVFPLYVLMVPSSVLTVAADGDHLTCGGFSLGKTICLGSFEFITYYFSGKSPLLGGATQALASWAQLEVGHRPAVGHDRGLHQGVTHSIKWGGGSGLPSPRRHSTGAPPTPVATSPCMENASATQAMMMDLLQVVVPRPHTGLPFE